MILSHVIRDSHRSEGAVDLVIEGGIITAILPSGTAPQEGHEVLELDNRIVIPGLWDEHVHFSYWAQHRRRVSLAGAGSALEAVAIMGTAVAEHAASANPDSVVVGVGYQDGLWSDQKTLALLDEATGDTPVALVSMDIHSGWVNSALIHTFGVLEHEEGVVRERPWFALSQRLSSVSDAVLDTWALEAAHHAASRGVVGIVDLEMRYGKTDWERRAASHQIPYPLMVECAVYPDDLDFAIAEGVHSGLEIAPGIRVGPFKIITDGSLNTRSAHCVDPYLAVEGVEYGAMNFPPQEIEAILCKARDAGFWLAVHAIGDQANRIILDIMEKHQLRGRIEHAQLVREEDFVRFGQLGVIASVQPEHAIDDRDVTDVYWADRADRAFALRTLVDRGAILVLGSDAPVSPLDPWVQIAAAVTRTRDGREPWQAHEGLTLEEALRFSTRTTVEVGQPADVVALDADPQWLMGALGKDMAKASDALRDVPVALTIRRGVVTHQALSA